jgi:hypothetical protein
MNRAEDCCSRIGEVYPITLIKFLLVEKEIKRMLKRTKNHDTHSIKIFKYNETCDVCKSDKLCRHHTSIERILNAGNIGFDLNTEYYFFKNEIFKFVDNKILIVYCPHTKLITGEITEEKIKMVLPTSVENPFGSEKGYFQAKERKINRFSSSTIMSDRLSCWFNSEFSIILKFFKASNKIEWCLITNK